MLQANGHDLPQQRRIDGQIGFFTAQVDQAGLEPAHDEFQKNGHSRANGQGPQGCVCSRRHHTVVDVHGEKNRRQRQDVGHHGGHHGFHIESAKAPQRAPKPVEGRALHGRQGLVMARGWQFQCQDLRARQGLQFSQGDTLLLHAFISPQDNGIVALDVAQNTGSTIDQGHQHGQNVMGNLGQANP